MQSILFTHSYFLRFDPKQYKQGTPYPPLGTLYAASVLRKAGYNVALHDTMLAPNTASIEKAMDDFKPDLLVIYDDGFNYLTKMCLTNMRQAAYEMLSIAAKKNCPSVVCSSDASDHYEKYLDQQATFIIKGEGEETLLELVNTLKSSNNNYSILSGLIFRQDGITVVNPARPVMRQLDNIPFPAWDLVNVKAYKKLWMKNAGYFSLNMVTTRGCPYKCNWCAKPIYGNRYNSRSPENVVQELLILKEKYDFDHIWFCDDIFGLKPGWVNHFANLLEKAKLKPRFKIQSRADLLVQENYVSDLSRAGCESVWIGAESGSQHILDAMEKGITVEQIHQATRLLKRHGISPAFFLQFGYPGETYDDITQTIRMLRLLMPDDIGISVSYPLPGTKFYDRVKEDMKAKTNWNDSDDLTMMFRNTYPSEFYKKLHRYVHKNFRKWQALDTLRSIAKNPCSVNRSRLFRAASIIYYILATAVEKNKIRKAGYEA